MLHPIPCSTQQHPLVKRQLTRKLLLRGMDVALRCCFCSTRPAKAEMLCGGTNPVDVEVVQEFEATGLQRTCVNTVNV